jgi:NAD(P)-dependent dehydrogenase (short-subunit alcohol dehydrogenase family)
MSIDGTIVLVSGEPARRAKPGQVSLASVGGVIEAMVKTVAPEIAPRRINVVSPSIIDTPLVPIAGKARQDLFAETLQSMLSLGRAPQTKLPKVFYLWLRMTL